MTHGDTVVLRPTDLLAIVVLQVRIHVRVEFFAHKVGVLVDSFAREVVVVGRVVPAGMSRQYNECNMLTNEHTWVRQP